MRAEHTTYNDNIKLGLIFARKNCHVSVDTSFDPDRDNHNAGTGVIITSPKSQGDIVLIQAFDMSQMEINNSREAELWGTVLALEQLKNFNIQKLTFDCSFVESRINDITTDSLNPDKYSGPIYDRLDKALRSAPDLSCNRVSREDKAIKMVDHFSRIATQDLDQHQIEALTAQYRAPLILHTVGEHGHIEDTTLHDATMPREQHREVALDC